MAKLRPDQLPDATAGSKFAHVVNKQNTTDGPEGTSERLELSNIIGAINPNHVFATTTARDAYFTSNPSELVAGIYCIVETPFSYFRYSGSVWVEQTGVVTGPKGDKGDEGSIDFSGLSNSTVPVVNTAGDGVVDSSITETATNIVMTKTLIVPQESLKIGSALTVSDKGGQLGLVNQAEGKEALVATNPIFETEAQRDAIFADGVPKIQYEYLVPAKWVYQFPFDTETSNANKVSFELVDSDNTYIRKFRLFSTKAQTGVRIWIENILPGGDELVWENVTEEEYNKGNGDALQASDFSEIEVGFIKISTANIRFRFNIQAQSGETIAIKGQNIDLGLGSYFYPQLYTFTQDSLDFDVADGNDLANNRVGDLNQEFRVDSKSIVLRTIGADSNIEPQPDSSQIVDDDRPTINYTNNGDPFILTGVTVKHNGTWSPVQFSFNDLRTTSTSLTSGDNKVDVTGKPLIIERGQSFYIRLTGAVGTGTAGKISLSGNASGEPYFKLHKTALNEKQIDNGGTTDVIEYNVDDDSTITLGKASVGKFISIKQDSLVAIPMIFTLESHEDFATGDIIKISKSESYVNYYFGVFYSDADGRVIAKYPGQSIELTRTDTGWDVIQGDRSTKTAVRPSSKAGTPFIGADPELRNVQAFTFIDHPAIQYIESAEGDTVIEIDLNKVSNNSNDTVDIVGWWTDNAAPTADDILNALGQVQTASLISHTDEVKADALPTTSISMKREETSAKYTYFAYPAGFFTDKNGAPLEPTLVNTGVGNSADWVVSTVDVDGVLYRIQRSPAQNVSQQLLTCKLIQEGY